MTVATLIDRLEPGDHVCWTFQDDQSRDAALAAYVSAAVPAGHKVVHYPHSSTPGEVLDALTGAGIDVPALTATGQLEVHSAREAYLGTGRFDAGAMITGCLDACTQARADGWAGLRLSGDMAWAAEAVSGADRLGWYEAQVNRVYVDGYAIGLCLYDARLFPRAAMKPVLAVHPTAVDAATDAAWSPLLRLRRARQTAHLRLEGEADLSNRGSLVAVLETLPAAGTDGPPVLDVTALRFVDVGTAHSILVAAARLGGLRIVGAAPHLLRLLDLLGAGRVPGLVLDHDGALGVPA